MTFKPNLEGIPKQLPNFPQILRLGPNIVKCFDQDQANVIAHRFFYTSVSLVEVKVR